MFDQVIGNYRILEKLGEGGMGEVYKGLDMMLEREVAIKSLRLELSRREDIVARFRTEAVALGRLNHPHIATVYNFLLHEGQYFLILEFVRGEGLDKMIRRRGAIPWKEALPLLCQTLDGLEHAHRLGIIHRDIKPANLMITPSATVKVMDFGIARILERSKLTRTGHIVGTLEYMSPEHVKGLETDARSDVYSVGAVAYEMLTGDSFFQRNTDYLTIKAQVEEVPQSLKILRPDIPDAIATAVTTALEKDPERRIPSAMVFHNLLESVLSKSRGLPIHTLNASPETRMVSSPFPAGNEYTPYTPAYRGAAQPSSRQEADQHAVSSATKETTGLPPAHRRFRLGHLIRSKPMVAGLLGLLLVAGIVGSMFALFNKQFQPRSVQPTDTASLSAPPARPQSHGVSPDSQQSSISAKSSDMDRSSSFEQVTTENSGEKTISSMSDQVAESVSTPSSKNDNQQSAALLQEPSNISDESVKTEHEDTPEIRGKRVQESFSPDPQWKSDIERREGVGPTGTSLSTAPLPSHQEKSGQHETKKKNASAKRQRNQKQQTTGGAVWDITTK